jgi:poly-beta-1,6-N-acetyl-D-glucosamine biosynthesis protein PgaD
MSASPIIDARRLLPWHRRALSDASTAILWSAWLWLWKPLLVAGAAVAHLGPRAAPALAPAVGKVLALGSGDVLQHSVVALLGASGTLIAWNRLPPRRARGAAPARAADLAPAAPEHELRAARDAAICVVHHDAHGRIVRVERREPAPAAARSA